MKTLLTVLCILVAVATGCTENDQDRTQVRLHPTAPAPALAPPATEDCISLIFNMVDCMTFLGNGGIETKPEGSCCSGFKMVVDKNADCICKALKSSISLGIEVNMNKAMKLPSACGLSSFKLADCKVKIPSTAAPPPKSPNVPTPTKPPAAPSGHAGTPAHRAAATSHASNGTYTTYANFSILFSLVVSASSFFNVLA
ncbi:non-specific lipid-transfer protein-like protein At2g13820 [Olea europaea var. sylvestris]|uniref:non-specific lipid-transfer protein-like protein At2g13820 n=1 Tax=Olea europaea var. sylvestris TaxID=158386 RepID=UPI000C1CDFAA|nr:non-specific lipid-transfer protein-like protein At2g13820 [Olea europaea var. sylvestris]